MSTSTREVVEKSDYWIRVNLALEFFVKEALIRVLHNPDNDPSYSGLPEDPVQLYQHMTRCQGNRNYRHLKPDQWALLCPKSGQSNSKEWDITLLICVIRNESTLSGPVAGWTDGPTALTDITKGGFVNRARIIRNLLKHGSVEAISTEFQFDGNWDEIEKILIGLNYQNMTDFHELKTKSLDKHNGEIRKMVTSFKMDLDSLKNEAADNTNEIELLNDKILTLEQTLKSEVDEIRKEVAANTQNINMLVEGNKDKIAEPPLHWDLRKPVNNFYGREYIIQDIKKKLDESTAVVISAMGGCGKTQTVAKFVQNHKHEFDNVFWLVASTIQTSLQKLNTSTTPGNQQGNLSVEHLSQRISTLTHGKKVLYVVDDVFEGDLENLNILLRNASNSNFLITTQLSELCNMITPSNISSINFPHFTNKESKAFLQLNILQAYSDEDIEKLSSELNAFPLCLQQAVSYINKHNTSILAYIKSFKDCKKPILDPKRTISDYDRTLLTVWSVAFDKLKTQNPKPKTLQVLAMMSMMDNSCIRKETFLYDKNIAEDEIELNEIIENLCEYSLVQTTGDCLIIHALVQKVVRIFLEANKLHLDMNLVQKILHDLLCDIAHDCRDIRNVDKENLWYIHLLKFVNAVQFENSTRNEIDEYELISEMASKRGDMESAYLFFEKEVDYFIQCYRDNKLPHLFFNALERYTMFISKKSLTKEDITKINSFEKEFESDLKKYLNEDVVFEWKFIRDSLLNYARSLTVDDVQTIKAIERKRKSQMSNHNDDLSLTGRYISFYTSGIKHLRERHCNNAKAAVNDFKEFMADNNFPIDQGFCKIIIQYFEAGILYLEGNYTEASNLLSEIPKGIEIIHTFLVTKLKTRILTILRRFDEARDCLPTDDEQCKNNIRYFSFFVYIQLMRNNFDEMKDLLRGFNIDFTFYCHLYAMAWTQFNQRKHSLKIERQGKIVFYLVKFKRYIIKQLEDSMEETLFL